MRQRLLLVSVLPFVSAFLGGILAFSVSTRSVAEAQEAGIRRDEAIATQVLFLMDRDGTVRAHLGTSPDGAAGLTLYNRSGEPRTRLEINEQGGLLRFGTALAPVLTIGELGNEVVGLLVRDYDNNFAALLQATPGGQVAFILPHVILEGYTPDPARPQLIFVDQQVGRRLSLGLEADDTPFLRVTDESGELLWSAP